LVSDAKAHGFGDAIDYAFDYTDCHVYTHAHTHSHTDTIEHADEYNYANFGRSCPSYTGRDIERAG
jgi:hypothetical protein